MNKNGEIQFFETVEKQLCKQKTVSLQNRFSSKPKEIQIICCYLETALFKKKVSRRLPVSIKEKG